MMTAPLTVCYFGTYRADYSRNRIMIEGLRSAGVRVVECHAPLWRGIEDRVQTASGGWARPGFVARILRAYWDLLRRHRTVGDYDVMVLGYPGQADALLARGLSRLRRKPLAMDVFMSIYLIAKERGLVDRHPVTGRLLRFVERHALALPDLLIQDTEEYVAWLRQTYGVAAERFALVPTGADTRVFKPIAPDGQPRDDFRVLYYGTFIPNHGVDWIVEAARLLGHESRLRFELLGDGPEKSRAVEFVRRHQLSNVTFEAWVDKGELPKRIARADVCLGAFGTTPQSMMTIQNKIYECMAMRRPVLSGESPTMRRTFVHGEQVYLCKRADGQALADAIMDLRRQPELRDRIAAGGHAYVQQHATVERIGELFKRHLTELVERHTARSRNRPEPLAELPRRGCNRALH